MGGDDRVDLVVGSGPSGIAAATALLKRGRAVTLIDVGTTLEPDRAALRDRLAEVEPDEWDPADREALGRSRHARASDTMLAFGSDFMMRPPPGEGMWGHAAREHDLAPSFARGGLSNGWGAATLPYRQEDIGDWPVSIAELAPHYSAAAEIAGITGGRDDLTPLFPALPPQTNRFLPLSSQAERLLARWQRKRSALAGCGIYVGRARQAVAAGCHRCGQCLHGCPYGLIFNAGAAIVTLQASGRFTYLPGHYVRRFAEEGGSVRLETSAGQFVGERLFLAAGVLPTASIVLASLGESAGPVTIRDSAHFYLPMLQRWPAGRTDNEAKHTLAQLFVEIIDPAISASTLHAQIYTYNDTYAPDMRRRFGRFARAAEPLIGLLSRHLIVAQGFLHSDLSPAIRVEAAATGGLTFETVANGETRAALTRASRAVAAAGRAGGLFPLMPLMRPGRIGSSFHCGGTFPMRARPGALETDPLGRINGFEHVHIVDASVFPSIPATTITLSVMANAHRIGATA